MLELDYNCVLDYVLEPQLKRIYWSRGTTGGGGWVCVEFSFFRTGFVWIRRFVVEEVCEISEVFMCVGSWWGRYCLWG